MLSTRLCSLLLLLISLLKLSQSMFPCLFEAAWGLVNASAWLICCSLSVASNVALSLTASTYFMQYRVQDAQVKTQESKTACGFVKVTGVVAARRQHLFSC